MIIDSKWMQPPPPPYCSPRPPPPPFTEARSSRHEKPTFSTLPSHLLLQVVYSTFPQSDGIYEGEGKVERQRRNLHWLETSLRLVNRALYIACMHILRSTYLPAYDSLIRHPYTSNPFPSSSAPTSPDSFFGTAVHRELATLDLFIALLAHEDVLLDATSLHLPREEAYKDLFDLMQPRSRLEDLVRDEGLKAGVIYLGDTPLPSQSEPDPTISNNREVTVSARATNLPTPSLPSTSAKDPNGSPPSPSPSPTRTSFNPFSYISLAKSKIRRPTPPLSPSSPSSYIDGSTDVPLSPTSPTTPTTPAYKRRVTPLPFSSLAISFSPRKVGLIYIPMHYSSTSPTGYNGSTFGALSMSVTGPTAAVGFGMTAKKTLVEIARSRDESLESSAKRLVAGLKDVLSAGEVV